ncbi:hypothetical protein NARC_170023 [Candidatus Nitrosocosmicus arcticus]|uniref:Uncharacterized protein n=1 Tax=Candidatus Nitrosocosmicus arcticus TaxID=2035267 RepID=A0A557SRQ0_9ARCH|nr:hypothetical protein NARC_170023 [Candidatus Nitrosocosmicus arcticus]
MGVIFILNGTQVLLESYTKISSKKRKKFEEQMKYEIPINFGSIFIWL